MATNYRTLCRKLQTALATYRGRYISISTYQAYSEKAGRMVTKYQLAEKTEEGYKNIYAAWTYPDVCKFLGELWRSGNAADTETEGVRTEGKPPLEFQGRGNSQREDIS